MRLALASVLFLACGPSLDQLRARELCYSRADADAQSRVDAECSGGFAACSARPDILAELQREQEACP